MSTPMAACGHNGNNETKIGSSSTISLSLLDAFGNEIPIKNSKQKIDVYVPRDPNAQKPTLNFVNVTENFKPGRQFLPTGFNITAKNSSVTIEIMPTNFSLGYLLIFKIGNIPRLNSTFQDLDNWKLFCPSDLQISTNYNMSCYKFFIKSAGDYMGLAGFSVRQLSDSELSTYCSTPGSKPTNPPAPTATNTTGNSTNVTNSFTADYSFLSFTSGCYYLDVPTGRWISDGVEVLDDTNAYYTHCATSHLTTFAGGWVVLPAKINFDYVFANASIEKNPTIYATIITLSCLYILFGIWGRYMDRQDLKKIGVAPLPDNASGDNYFYEIIVFTGSRMDAGTDSKVSCPYTKLLLNKLKF